MRFKENAQPVLAHVGDPVPGLIRDWRDAEVVTEAWIRRLGSPDACLTRPGADGGIDVVSRGMVAQVKWYSSKRVGIEKVQRHRGVAKSGQKSPFFSSPRGYTLPAVAWAFDPDHRVPLFQLRSDGTLVAVNWHALNLLWRAPDDPPHLWTPLPRWLKLTTLALCLPLLAAQFCLIAYIAASDGLTRTQWAAQLINLLFAAMWWLPISLLWRRELRRLRAAARSVLRREPWPGSRWVATDPQAEIPPSQRPARGFVRPVRTFDQRLLCWFEAMSYAARAVARRWAARPRASR